ncbi:MAG: hypothetical protein QOF48_1987, partial [Verrucomicrobiota bacterium]
QLVPAEIEPQMNTDFHRCFCGYLCSLLSLPSVFHLWPSVASKPSPEIEPPGFSAAKERKEHKGRRDGNSFSYVFFVFSCGNHL